MLLLALLACDPAKPVTDAPADDTGADTHGGDDTGDGPVGNPDLLCQLAMTCPDGLADEPKMPCELAITDGDGAPVYDAMAMVEIRGRSSKDFPKPPYAVELHRAARYLVPPHATWHYLDGDQSPDAGWEQPGYDASSWSQGMAPLGYGDDPATEIDGGTDGARPPSVWFRATFEVDDPAAIEELELALVRDDAAVVWINGTEVARSNLAPGAGSDAWALTTVQDEFEEMWTEWEVNPALLVAGQNTIAVEVHQADAYSSDLRFDASLLASAGRNTPDLFGMGGEDDWVLGSAYVDRVLWRNKLAYDLFQSFGGDERWAPEQVFCELTLDGTYEGVYLLGESVRRDEDRLDIGGTDGTAATFIVKNDEEGGFTPSTTTYGEWQAIYPRWTEDNGVTIDEIAAELGAWEAALLARDEAQWDHLDLDSAVDWVILQELFKNSDAYYLSVHLWRDGGPMHFVPWDLDLSLGYPYTDCGATGFVWRTEMPEGFADSPAFKERLVERWAELRAGPLTDATIRARIDAYEATMGDAIQRNFERWPVEDIAFGWGDEDNWLCPASSWEEEHDRVLAWLPERTAWLDAHLGEY